MVLFPNGKINLGLHVTGKRKDGFHDVETIFYPVAIHDVVEIIAAVESSFASSGIDVDGSPANNLCVKAYDLLKKDFPRLPPVAIQLYKNIPVGAGLGGGSADAVACLQLLDQLGGLALSTEQISVYALALGSDCPFFLKNRPCLATGRGEILSELKVDLSAYEILIVNPGIHINTGWAFAALEVLSAGTDLKEIISRPIDRWKDSLHNDFEKIVFNKYPAIEALKADLYKLGAVYSSLSGSGSTVYGLFGKKERPDVHFPSHFFKWI